MTTAPDAVVRTWFDELWNQGREETIDRLFAHDAVAHGLGPDPIVGPAAFRPFFRAFRSAFPDLHIDVKRVISQGDMVSACCHVTGTHTGAGMGAPTNAGVDFWGMTMLRVRDGQIVEGWNTFDFMTCYQQMGLLPPLVV
jgi:steroid delta-isomerase-like uncharacterized protein